LCNAAAAKAQASLEAARTHREGLSAALDVALMKKKQDGLLAEAALRTDEINLLNAKKRLDETKIVSPMDAVVVARNVQVGQMVPADAAGGVTIMTLSDLSRIFVLASVDENDFRKVRAGAPVGITSDAYPGVLFHGQVSRIAARGTRVSNVATFEVKAEVTGPNKNLLKPGMTANVVITPG
jgi:HlyD family secretion protein